MASKLLWILLPIIHFYLFRVSYWATVKIIFVNFLNFLFAISFRPNSLVIVSLSNKSLSVHIFTALINFSSETLILWSSFLLWTHVSFQYNKTDSTIVLHNFKTIFIRVLFLNFLIAIAQRVFFFFSLSSYVIVQPRYIKSENCSKSWFSNIVFVLHYF